MNGVNVMQDGNIPIYTATSYFFSEIIARIAVPLFFFMSGFLFFYKMPAYTMNVFGAKFKTRLKTILVPYLFWNLAVIALYYLSQLFFPYLMSGETKLISSYSFLDWGRAFWNIQGGMPICYQFWFMRDLMVVMLFSPLIYLVLKLLRGYAIIVLGVLWLCNYWFTLSGFSIAAFFFFSLGAYFSIYKKNFVTLTKPFLPITAILYPLISIVVLCFRDQNWCQEYLSQINILLGMVLTISLVSYFLKKGTFRVNQFLSDSSFFIYAYHGMVLIFLIKILVKILKPQSDGMALAIYVISPLIVITGGLLIYSVIKKYFPRITRIITGGR